MTSGRTADCADVRGVDLQFVGIRAEPADGRLAIVNIRRPRRLPFARQQVIDAHRHVAVVGQRRPDIELAARIALAAGPAAAVNDDYRR